MRHDARMPIVLVLLFVFLLLALWVVLLPLSLWQRYRYGRSRRMARSWLLALNAWSLLVSVAIFMAVSALGLFWWPDSLIGAGLGLAAGSLLGLLGVWLTVLMAHLPRGPGPKPSSRCGPRRARIVIQGSRFP